MISSQAGCSQESAPCENDTKDALGDARTTILTTILSTVLSTIQRILHDFLAGCSEESAQCENDSCCRKQVLALPPTSYLAVKYIIILYIIYVQALPPTLN